MERASLTTGVVQVRRLCLVFLLPFFAKTVPFLVVLQLAEAGVDPSAARMLSASLVRHRAGLTELLLPSNAVGDGGAAAIAGVRPQGKAGFRALQQCRLL